mmetsp:Transcript_1598/g.4798  ORF Transcript_1598/g.4798 Transcript_1598/m.4798 type:complete len:708 (-) Transcript_1598:413-2536(-)|eukprot:CAMPEP_0198733360 /NCGR_PEP_ID=MMETSP1475-20131203/45082_1 /TAXON_ID= ORGANISM="Unidentified sp., Strain CCMP1999" /NCGR_SAMPLE_ID=MMETSP1475 /ASSEMBLY_ACC=CAM_ASM_001111 /LENGTH=707 /DNA_ID=CAMNT_0044496645 /DNA_START=153 /DNA_END=2276 /DNA_ORIENTATION=-
MVKAHIELLGSSTGDSNQSALLFFDEQRYLFECGEGTQRLCTEYGVNIVTDKLKKIFVSRMDPSSIGGILGLALTVADGGRKAIHIVGPQGLGNLVAQSKSFFCRPNMGLEITEVPSEDHGRERCCFDEPNVLIEAVPVCCAQRIANALQEEPESKKRRGPVAISYLCRVKDIPGKFDAKKAAALGIPKGPLYGKLMKGETITLEDGRSFRPDEIIAPSTPGPVVVLVTSPDESYISGITQEKRLSAQYLDAYSNAKRSICLIHFAPLRVLQDEQYISWATSFKSPTTHIFVDNTINPLRPVFQGHADAICRANATLGDRFAPLPRGYRGETERPEVLSALSKIYPGKVAIGDTLLRFTLAPPSSTGIDTSNVPNKTVNVASIAADVCNQRSVSVVPEDTDTPETEDSPPQCLQALPRNAAELKFLGTAAAMPGKHRNVTCILLNLFDRGCVLFDCGEGSYGQMVRSLGREKADAAVRSLNFVYISHSHADHHLGLMYMLSKTAELRPEKPLVIVGPAKLREWLTAYCEATDSGASFLFIDNSELIEPQQPISSYFRENFGVKLTCCEVIHCPQAYGVALEDCINHWKLSYSGDTMPSTEFIKLGMNSTVAIHEATLEDGMEEEASGKAHSTVGQALSACEQMHAYRTILTHFSQRYPRVPVLNLDSRFKRAGVAFDFLTVNFTDLPKLPSIVPKLLALYPDEPVVP